MKWYISVSVMSEIKKENHRLSIVKTGDERSPDTSYTEYLSQDSKSVPEFMVQETYDYLGSEDIDTSRYISRDFFEKEKGYNLFIGFDNSKIIGCYITLDSLDKENTSNFLYNSCLNIVKKLF